MFSSSLSERRSAERSSVESEGYRHNLTLLGVGSTPKSLARRSTLESRYAGAVTKLNSRKHCVIYDPDLYARIARLGLKGLRVAAPHFLAESKNPGGDS